MASPTPLHLEITIISAKHLKNVNWRNGDLKPYATFYLDNSDHRLATHADDSLSTRPVWNERFSIPIIRHDSVLTLEIFHSKPSETPKPLVGTVKFPLSQLLDSDESTPYSVLTLELSRPSGRPQGKVLVKLEVKERPLPPPVQDYRAAPNYSHCYNPAPVQPPARDYREYSPSPYGYTDQYGYYPACYPSQPPLPSRPLYNRASNNSFPGGPSAPVDLCCQPSPLPYDHKPPQPVLLQKTSNYGVPSGPSAPVDYSYGKGSGPEITGAIGGLNLEEGSNYEKEKVAADKESHSSYRRVLVLPWVKFVLLIVCHYQKLIGVGNAGFNLRVMVFFIDQERETAFKKFRIRSNNLKDRMDTFRRAWYRPMSEIQSSHEG
ncbi:hypothetical protein POTOM_001934 [Populus tomentosa]|uniref:C2 domain-containing protein n=1 Tax=Populus tomentosa TaxID=118781 RepID=A0A8X8DIU9_POPTO|nr:hypothetical protein POTOM_001934 [Populus tomentosa]